MKEDLHKSMCLDYRKKLPKNPPNKTCEQTTSPKQQQQKPIASGFFASINLIISKPMQVPSFWIKFYLQNLHCNITEPV